MEQLAKLSRFEDKVAKRYHEIMDPSNSNQRSRFYVSLQDFRRYEKNLRGKIGFNKCDELEALNASSRRISLLVESSERRYQESQWAA